MNLYLFFTIVKNVMKNIIIELQLCVHPSFSRGKVLEIVKLHPSQHWVIIIPIIFNNYTGERWHFVIVLIYISLIPTDEKYAFYVHW